MKRNLRKAFAFVLAVITVVATIGGATPATAAEYGEAKNVLDTKYERVDMLDKHICYTNSTVVDGEKYLGELVVVDDSGNVTNVEVKDSAGNPKYRTISIAMDWTSICLIESDSTYELYNIENETWFGNGTKEYSEIYIVDNGTYIVTDENGTNLVDAKENILVKDIYTKTPAEEAGNAAVWTWVNVYGDYIIAGKSLEVYENDEWTTTTSARVFDKDYKEVTTIDLENKNYNIVNDTLVVYAGTTVEMYGPDLKPITCKIDLSKEAAEGFVIDGVFGRYEETISKDIIVVRLRPADGWDFIFKYYDAATQEEIDLAASNGYGPMTAVEGTSITVKNDAQQGMQFYKGETLLFGYMQVREYLAAKYSTEEVTLDASQVYVTIYDRAVSKDVIVEYQVNLPSQQIRGVGLITDESGYKLEEMYFFEPAQNQTYIGIQDVRCYDEIQVLYLSGGIVYVANTIYSQGEFELHSYDMNEEGNYEPNAYSLMKGTEGAYTWDYCLLNGTKLYTSSKPIYGAVNVNMIVTVDMEKELYGCVVLSKTLDSMDDVVTEVENAKPGDKIEVALKENASLPADVLTNIKGEDITLVIETPDAGVKWTINGKDVTGTDLKNIDLSVKKVENVIPADAIGAIEMDSDAKVEISLGHNGEFGFSAKLEVNVDKANAGKYANRFYYNPETKALEFKETVKVDEDGNAVFTFTHASDYVVLISDTSYEILQAGDNVLGYIGVIALVGVAFVAVAVSFKRKARA